MSKIVVFGVSRWASLAHFYLTHDSPSGSEGLHLLQSALREDVVNLGQVAAKGWRVAGVPIPEIEQQVDVLATVPDCPKPILGQFKASLRRMHQAQNPIQVKRLQFLQLGYDVDLANLICELSGFDGVVKWDTSKPDGQPRRRLDTSRAKKEFGFEAKTGLGEGLRNTVEWYAQHSRRTATRHQDGKYLE